MVGPTISSPTPSTLTIFLCRYKISAQASTEVRHWGLHATLGGGGGVSGGREGWGPQSGDCFAARRQGGSAAACRQQIPKCTCVFGVPGCSMCDVHLQLQPAVSWPPHLCRSFFSSIASSTNILKSSGFSRMWGLTRFTATIILEPVPGVYLRPHGACRVSPCP